MWSFQYPNILPRLSVHLLHLHSTIIYNLFYFCYVQVIKFWGVFFLVKSGMYRTTHIVMTQSDDIIPDANLYLLLLATPRKEELFYSAAVLVVLATWSIHYRKCTAIIMDFILHPYSRFCPGCVRHYRHNRRVSFKLAIKSFGGLCRHVQVSL